jgi:hypothetical protein
VGTDDNGNAVSASYDLTITLASGNGTSGVCSSHPFLCSPGMIGLIIVVVVGVAVIAFQRTRSRRAVERKAVAPVAAKARVSDVKYRVSCKVELPQDAKFCDSCGASQP